MDQIIKFFFPAKIGIVREAITEVKSENGKTIIHREFYTFRAFYTHYYYELIKNPIEFWKNAFKINHIILQRGSIGFDSVDSNNGGSSYPHTCTGVNMLLLLGTADTSAGISAASYNSVSMSNYVSEHGGASSVNVDIFGLIAPSAGAHTVSITGSSGNNASWAASYSGCKQSGQPDASDKNLTNSSNSITCSPSVVSPVCWMFAVFNVSVGGVDNNTVTMGSAVSNRGTTQGWTAQRHGNIGDSNGIVGTGSQICSATSGGGTPAVSACAIAAISFLANPVANTASLSDASLNAASRFSVLAKNISKIISDSIMVAKSRLITIGQHGVYARALIVNISNGASRLAILVRSFIRLFSDNIMNSSNRLTSITKVLVNGLSTIWSNITESISPSWSNKTKSAAPTWIDDSVHNTNWNNNQKS